MARDSRVAGSGIRVECRLCSAAMVPIKQAAALTGVPEHTLRAWERRYGAFRTVRSAGGYRLYDEDALASIAAMRALVEAGVPPRLAAEQIRPRPGQAISESAAGTRVRPDQLQPVVEALAHLDVRRVTRLVDEQFALRDFETFVDAWLMPALQRVGTAWARQEITVAGEHLMSAIVMRRLSAAYDAAGVPAPRPQVIVGTPSGILHDLGLMAFAVCLRRQGTATMFLGSDVPPPAWTAALTSTGAAVSVTALYRRSDAARVATLADQMWQEDASAILAVGGGQQRLAPTGCLQLGHEVAPAAQRVASIVAQSAP